MEIKYSTDKTTLILIALLKAHGIRIVVASPGTTNAMFVASLQQDDFFTMYSAVDERSAAYMACGLAQSSGEPVVITCTEATASRNYFSGLTEAYYRKLPILAITGNHSRYNIGHLHTQSIDRTQSPKDAIRYSTSIGHCRDDKDEWHINVEINKALLELRHNGGGPVHIDLQIGERWDFYTEKLPSVRVIKRVSYKDDELPSLPEGRIAIVIGAHKPFSEQETTAIEKFCKNHDAAVFIDMISGYNGDYAVNASLLGAQKSYTGNCKKADLVIHIGEVGYSSVKSKQTWRISEDGEIRDTYHNLTYVFEMDEKHFFERYASETVLKNEYYALAKEEVGELCRMIPELPFSNAWIAYNTVGKLPHHSVFHAGILNSFRVWNFFPFDKTIETSCNFGGFGIDGCLSTVIGSSLIQPRKIHYIALGDLSFFYDMNSIGNRHLGNNLRILLVNNGKGNEFRNNIHPASKFGEAGDAFVAAAGHFGNKSELLVRHYAEDLGFKYMKASSKEEYLSLLPEFVDGAITTSMIFEVYTTTEDESESLDILNSIKSSTHGNLKEKVKDAIGELIGDKGKATLKGFLKK